MPTALAVQDLTKRFGKAVAVDRVSFEVEAGEIFGLLGPNGSGKSTTLRCALGLLSPTAGGSEVLGTPSRKIHRLPGRIGVALDSASLVANLSALDNLEYARKLSRSSGGRTAAEALRAVGLEAHARKHARKLSLGQGRRLAIARALLGEPELLVLDEPLSGLDTVGVRSMLKLFRELASSGLTLVLSSHRLFEMEKIVDRVAILASGKLLATSTLGKLCDTSGSRLIVVVDDEKGARKVLGDVTLEASSVANGRTALTLESAGKDPAAINRALVEAGCNVHELTAHRRTLQDAFEELLDASESEGCAR